MTSYTQLLYLVNTVILLNVQKGDPCGSGSSNGVYPTRSSTTRKPSTTPWLDPKTATPYENLGTTATELMETTTAMQGLDEFERQLQVVDEKLSQVNVTTEDIQLAAEIIANITSDEELISKDPLGVELVLTSLESVVAMEDPSVEVTEPVVRTVNNVMDFDEYTLMSNFSGTGGFISALERQVSALQTKHGNFSKILPNVGILAMKIDFNVIDSDLTFANIDHEEDEFVVGEDLREDNIRVLNGDKLGDDGKRALASISVPVDAIGLSTEGNHSATVVPVSFSVYGNDKLFNPSKPLQPAEVELDDNLSTNVTESIASQIVSVRIETNSSMDTQLSPDSAIVVKFTTDLTVETDEEIESIHCVAWNSERETGRGYWSEDVCETTLDDGDMTLTDCSCRRLASYAVLIRVRKGNYTASVTLSFITLIGSIISATCLVLCIVAFTTLKQLRSKLPTHIHINLCLSLLGFYTAFLLSKLAVGDKLLCTAFSAVIHFFCLATVFWMSVEATNMFSTFVTTKPSGRIRFFIPIACLFAYGGPAAIAILVAIFDRSAEYDKVLYCFIQPGKALYFGFLAVVGILFLFNVVVFILVIRKVLLRPLLVSRTIANAKRNEIITRVRHGISFWFLLGLSWIFAFLAITDSKTEIFVYLFCISISLQGLSMFLMLCVGNREFRNVFLKFSNNLQTFVTLNLTDVSQSASPRHHEFHLEKSSKE